MIVPDFHQVHDGPADVVSGGQFHAVGVLVQQVAPVRAVGLPQQSRSRRPPGRPGPGERRRAAGRRRPRLRTPGPNRTAEINPSAAAVFVNVLMPSPPCSGPPPRAASSSPCRPSSAERRADRVDRPAPAPSTVQVLSDGCPPAFFLGLVVLPLAMPRSGPRAAVRRPRVRGMPWVGLWAAPRPSSRVPRSRGASPRLR